MADKKEKTEGRLAADIAGLIAPEKRKIAQGIKDLVNRLVPMESALRNEIFERIYGIVLQRIETSAKGLPPAESTIAESIVDVLEDVGYDFFGKESAGKDGVRKTVGQNIQTIEAIVQEFTKELRERPYRVARELQTKLQGAVEEARTKKAAAETTHRTAVEKSAAAKARLEATPGDKKLEEAKRNAEAKELEAERRFQEAGAALANAEQALAKFSYADTIRTERERAILEFRGHADFLKSMGVEEEPKGRPKTPAEPFSWEKIEAEIAKFRQEGTKVANFFAGPIRELNEALKKRRAARAVGFVKEPFAKVAGYNDDGPIIENVERRRLKNIFTAGGIMNTLMVATMVVAIVIAVFFG